MFRWGTIVLFGMLIPFPVWEEIPNGMPWGSYFARFFMAITIVLVVVVVLFNIFGG